MLRGKQLADKRHIIHPANHKASSPERGEQGPVIVHGLQKGEDYRDLIPGALYFGFPWSGRTYMICFHARINRIFFFRNPQ